MVALSGLGFRIRCLRFDSCFTASFKGYMLKTRFGIGFRLLGLAGSGVGL